MKRDTGGLANEAFMLNCIVSSKRNKLHWHNYTTCAQLAVKHMAFPCTKFWLVLMSPWNRIVINSIHSGVFQTAYLA